MLPFSLLSMIDVSRERSEITLAYRVGLSLNVPLPMTSGSESGGIDYEIGTPEVCTWEMCNATSLRGGLVI